MVVVVVVVVVVCLVTEIINHFLGIKVKNITDAWGGELTSGTVYPFPLLVKSLVARTVIKPQVFVEPKSRNDFCRWHHVST